MKAVWSFWSAPYIQNPKPWPNHKLYLLSWILSLETAKRHYQQTVLVTDDFGVSVLVEGLGLEFTTVSRSLNALHTYDAAWLTLGKIQAYAEQEEPFVHLDNDVFLWERLPHRLETAPILAQHPEYFSVGQSDYYRPQEFEQSLLTDRRGWLPMEWLWYRALYGNNQKSVNCGIFGGNNMAFINYYANLVYDTIHHNVNQALFLEMPDKKKRVYMGLLEQFLLAACVEYHTDNKHSDYTDIFVEYLFHCEQDAYHQARVIGYTHMAANTKMNPKHGTRLEERVKQDYPVLYRRCLDYLEQHKSGL